MLLDLRSLLCRMSTVHGLVSQSVLELFLAGMAFLQLAAGTACFSLS